MVIRTKKNAPALKHGGYSSATLLPGEDPAALKKLYNALIAELCPNGALEEDIVTSIARLVWRKHHLATFRIVGSAREDKSRAEDDIDPDKAVKLYQSIIDEKPN